MQLVAAQTHHEDLSSIQLKLALDDVDQILSPQQGLAELQQPHQQHVVSPSADMWQLLQAKHRAVTCHFHMYLLHVLPAAEVDTGLGWLHACNMHSCLLICMGLQCPDASHHTCASCFG